MPYRSGTVFTLMCRMSMAKRLSVQLPSGARFMGSVGAEACRTVVGTS
jgi:hypothetical protein